MTTVTALHEAQAFGFPASSVAIVPVECDLRATVDLRDPAVHALLHTNNPELHANFRSLPPVHVRARHSWWEKEYRRASGLTG